MSEKSLRYAIYFSVAAIMLLVTVHFYMHPTWINHDNALALFFGKINLSPDKWLYKDFYEEDFPFIFWFYTPITWFYRKFELSPAPTMHTFYMLVFTIHMLILSYWVKKFPREHLLRSPWAAPLWISILLIMSGECFGQKDHLVASYLIPFYLMRHLHHKGIEIRSNKFMLFLTAIWGGMGFATRCNYTLSLLLFELPFLIKQRKQFFKELTRPEFLTQLAMALLLFASIYTMPREAIDGLWETMWNHMYERRAYQTTWWDLIVTYSPFYFSALVAAVLYLRREDRTIQTSIYLLIIGFFLSSSVSGRNWEYHYMPSILTGVFALFAIPLYFLRGKKWSFLIPTVATVALMIYWLATGTPRPATYLVSNDYFWSRVPKRIELVKRFHTRKNRPIAYYGLNISPKFPVIVFTDIWSAGRYINLEDLPDFYYNDREKLLNNEFHPFGEREAGEQLIVDRLAQDLKRDRPYTFIFEKDEFPMRELNLYEYFKNDPELGSILSSYDLVYEDHDVVVLVEKDQ